MEVELESYQFQLSQVSLALETDPSNAELSSLKTELEELIDLTKQAIGADKAAAATAAAATNGGHGSSSGSHQKHAASAGVEKYKPGQDVSAKYKDGKWYEAKVTAVIGSAESPLYTVVFKGYNTPTTLQPIQIRTLTSTNVSSSTPGASSSGSSSTSAAVISAAPTISEAKRKLTEQEERDLEKKKKKNEKWTETMKARAQETKEKQSAWQNFGKKAAKRGVKIGGLEGKSMFKTPDNPLGKVGVIGSGQGMTNFEHRGKHKFEVSGTGKTTEK